MIDGVAGQETLRAVGYASFDPKIATAQAAGWGYRKVVDGILIAPTSGRMTENLDARPDRPELIDRDCSGVEFEIDGNPLQIRRGENMKKELLGEKPSYLEKLLVDRICICYLHTTEAEKYYSAVIKSTLDSSGMKNYLDQLSSSSGRAQTDFIGIAQKRLDKAQKMYLRAIKALVQVRKMEISVILNIGENKINMR